MSKTVATGNQYLHQMPVIALQHAKDVPAIESSPKSVPVEPAHKGAAPEAGAKGVIS